MNTKKTLMQFVETGGRVFLAKPIVDSGYYYATNGRIAIRMPNDGSLTSDETSAANSHERLPDVIKTIEEKLRIGGGQTFVPVAMPSAVRPCPDCFGYGKFKKCNECEDGEFWHGSHWYVCLQCEGSGTLIGGVGDDDEQCETCDGTGNIPENVVINGSVFYGPFIKRIASLPNIEISAKRFAIFRFTGGMGVILPIHQH